MKFERIYIVMKGRAKRANFLQVNLSKTNFIHRLFVFNFECVEYFDPKIGRNMRISQKIEII